MSVFVVFDSWAVLAWIRDEPAAPRVNQILEQADASDLKISLIWINAGEVYYMLVRKHNQHVADEYLSRLPSLPIRLVLPDEQAVTEAAKLKSTRRLSYADGFAAELAIRENATLVTGDPELYALRDILSVEWIGPPVEPPAAILEAPP
jgi:predicted nucleic acid-binding protein